MVRGNPAVRNFLIVLIVGGFSVIAISELDAFPQITGEFDIRFPELRTLEIISVDVDPSGNIVGNLVLGGSDLNGLFLTAGGSSSQCSLAPNTNQNPLVLDRPTRWAVDSRTDLGSTCKFGIAEFDLSEIPDDFEAEQIIFKLRISENFSQINSEYSCKVGIIEQPFDTIPLSDLGDRLFNPDIIIVSGDWCTTSGVKTFFLDPTSINAFERAIKGDDKLTLSFSTVRNTFDFTNIPAGTLGIKQIHGLWEIDHQYWKTEGSFLLNGFARPLTCQDGYHQVGFSCEPLDCGEGLQVSGNECVPIQCPTGQELVGSICKPIECNVGEELVGNTCRPIVCPAGTELVGSECQQIICNEGFMLSGSQCVPIVCPTGQELQGSQCVQIQCPTGTVLQGNDCVAIQCPTGTELIIDNCEPIICPEGQVLMGDICKPIECDIGERLEGNQCVQIQCDTGTELIGFECKPIQCPPSFELQGNTCVEVGLDCPSGTVERENVCVQIVPTLMAEGAPVSILTLAGLSTFIIGMVGLVVRSIRLRGF